MHLKQHKYSGSDEGIAYIYFFNPLARYIVENMIPEYIAPNTLTFIGFLHTLFPVLILFTVFGTAIIGDLPTWFILL